MFHPPPWIVGVRCFLRSSLSGLHGGNMRRSGRRADSEKFLQRLLPQGQATLQSGAAGVCSA
jgi:hypothetical protein